MPGWRPFERAAILFNTLRALRDGALPIAVLVGLGVARGGLELGDLGRAAFYAVLGAAVATIAGVVEWSTTRWCVTDGDVRRRSGLVSRTERSVPLTRVESLDAVQGPLQRALGVVTIHVQTAGGGKQGEIVLTALSAADAASLHEAARIAPRATEEGPARRLRAGELMAAAVTAGQAGAVIAVAAAVGQVVAVAVQQGEDEDLEGIVAALPETATGWLVVVAALIVVSTLLAAAGTVVAFAGFTVRREGDRLRITRGLLSRRVTTVPVRRVQGVRIVEGLLRQPFGLAAVRVEVLGFGAEPAAAQTLFPLLRRRELPAFLELLLPEHPPLAQPLSRPPARALRAYVLLPAAVAAVPAGAAALVWERWWPLVAVLAAAAYGAAQWSASGWGLEGTRAAVRRRRIARTTLLFDARRAQTAGVSASLLQRRAGLATVRIGVGPGAAARARSLEAEASWRLWSAVRPG